MTIFAGDSELGEENKRAQIQPPSSEPGNESLEFEPFFLAGVSILPSISELSTYSSRSSPCFLFLKKHLPLPQAPGARRDVDQGDKEAPFTTLCGFGPIA